MSKNVVFADTAQTVSPGIQFISLFKIYWIIYLTIVFKCALIVASSIRTTLNTLPAFLFSFKLLIVISVTAITNLTEIASQMCTIDNALFRRNSDCLISPHGL